MDYILTVSNSGITIPNNLPVGTYRLVAISENDSRTKLSEILLSSKGNLYRAINALMRKGYRYLEELDGKNDIELLKVRDIGVNSLANLIIFCEKKNIKIAVQSEAMIKVLSK